MRPNTPEHKKKKQFVLDEEKRFEHYQKLYFHEIEFREKLHARVGLPLTITISLLGATGVLWQLINSTAGDFLVLKVLITATTCCVLLGAYFLWRSFCGHTYSGMPSAADSEEYRKLLDKTYEPHFEGKKLSAAYFKDYIVDYLIQRSSVNASTNEVRAFQLHRANQLLFFAAASLACIGVIFFIVEPKKPMPSIQIQGPIEIKSPIEIKPMQTNNQLMTRIPPPPPPPPPPPREIREGVRPSAPPQKPPTK